MKLNPTQLWSECHKDSCDFGSPSRRAPTVTSIPLKFRLRRLAAVTWAPPNNSERYLALFWRNERPLTSSTIGSELWVQALHAKNIFNLKIKKSVTKTGLRLFPQTLVKCSGRTQKNRKSGETLSFWSASKNIFFPQKKYFETTLRFLYPWTG